MTSRDRLSDSIVFPACGRPPRGPPWAVTGGTDDARRAEEGGGVAQRGARLGDGAGRGEGGGVRGVCPDDPLWPAPCRGARGRPPGGEGPGGGAARRAGDRPS